MATIIKCKAKPELKIDKGIPIPKGYRGSKVRDVYTGMDKGDSVFFFEERNASNFATAMRAGGYKAAVRAIYDESGAKVGYRTWML